MKFKNVDKITTRHGKTVYYYRPERGTRIKLLHAPDHPDFGKHYEAAVNEWTEMQIHKRTQLTNEHEKRRLEKMLIDRVKNAKARDKKHGRESNITGEWAVDLLRSQNYKCAVTGISFFETANKWRVNPFHPSLDRLDNTKGYMMDNVRLVLLAVNMMRLDWGDSVFDCIANAYVRNRHPQTVGISPNLFKIVKHKQTLAKEENQDGRPTRTETNA